MNFGSTTPATQAPSAQAPSTGGFAFGGGFGNSNTAPQQTTPAFGAASNSQFGAAANNSATPQPPAFGSFVSATQQSTPAAQQFGFGAASNNTPSFGATPSATPAMGSGATPMGGGQGFSIGTGQKSQASGSTGGRTRRIIKARGGARRA